MQPAIRRYVTAGVAVVGASVITVAPVVPVAPVAARLPDVQAPAVQLTAGFDDLVTPYVELFQHTAASLKALVGDWLGNPVPFLRQILDNQLGYVHAIFAALHSGDLSAAGGAVVDALKDTAQNFLNVIHTLTNTAVDFDDSNLFADVQEPSTADLISAILSGNFHDLLQQAVDEIGTADLQLGLPVALLVDTVGAPYLGWHALVDSVDAVVSAVREGDWSAAVTTLLTAPAVVGDAYLNGSGAPLDILVALGILPDDVVGSQFDLGSEPVEILGQTGTAHLGEITVVGLDGNLPLGGLLAPPAHPDLEVTLQYSGGQVVFDPICVGPFCHTPSPLDISSDPDTFPISRELTGTPIGGIVPGLVNGVPQQLADAITPAATTPGENPGPDVADATALGPALEHLLT